jgi:peptide/nickel transport system substrate-binding protein
MKAAAYETQTGDPAGEHARSGVTRRGVLGGAAALGLAAAAPGIARASAPDGQLTWGLHVSLAPTWFDPAETQGIITPYMVLYALHDAVAKDMPGKPLAPCLAESWTVSDNHLTHEFVLRPDVMFHNGEKMTSEDVKFSFERYKGASHALLKEKVAAIETPEPRRILFRLKEPWPDFLTFYASATGAGWVVPKKYVEEVGEEGFRRHPIGAGPYKFVSFSPGVELVLEAFEGYWRKVPNVKRLVMKVIPDESTRAAALRAGEIDIAYSIRGEIAQEIRNAPGLTLKPVVLQAPNWLYFPEQWDPKSPWNKLEVRQAVNLAIDREGMNKALFLGYCKVTNNAVVPYTFDYYWQPPEAVYDPARARKLMQEAGYRNGFDAGLLYCDSSYANMAEVSVNNLAQIGIRTRLQPIERAGFWSGYGAKKYERGIIQGASAAFGNAATRMAAFVVKGGPFVYGSYPEIDELFPKQAEELDRDKRAAILHRMQQLVHEKAMYCPIWQLGFINAVGPRVGESTFGLIEGFAYTAPFEDITIKS